MTISTHLEQFAGYQVLDWDAAAPLADPKTSIYRLSLDWDAEQTWPELFRQFMAQPEAKQIRGLVVGAWDNEMSTGVTPEQAGVIEALVSSADELPHLHALFVGDVTYEECEVSWIMQADLSPLLTAYAGLTHLGVRGSAELSLGRMHLPELRYLLLQGSGLDAVTVREVLQGHLPKLEQLELYVGDNGYGGDSTPQDLQPLLTGELFPYLRSLGLKNSPFQDELAELISTAPLLSRLEQLDLSLGSFSDRGLKALLSCERLTHLKRLILIYDHCEYSPPLMAELKAKWQSLGVQVISEISTEGTAAAHFAAQGLPPSEEWRYTSLSE